MKSLHQSTQRYRWPACALLAALAALLALRLFAAQEAHKPLSEKEVIDLLTNDVAPPRVTQLAKQYGITFQVTTLAEQHLRDAGADDNLISTLRSLAPKAAAPPSEPASPSSPPVLLIVSTPGEAQVYIDDEPVGTTSPEGRLRMSKLGAGQHTVRLTHAGYKDFEQSVELTSGLLTVTAQLETASASSGGPPAAGSQPSSDAPSANPSAGTSASAGGVMGMFFRTAGSGGRAGEVTALVPDGPAERAGIRPGYVIVSVGGRSVTTQQDIQQATAGHPPGSILPVTYNAGSGTQTVQVTLADTSIFQTVPHFRVAHDHGPPAPNYCAGWMWVFDGMVTYVADTGVTPSGYNGPKHNLEFPTQEIREVRKNGFYMAAFNAFHIRMKNGTVANFIKVNQLNQYELPHQIISAIERAMNHN